MPPARTLPYPVRKSRRLLIAAFIAVVTISLLALLKKQLAPAARPGELSVLIVVDQLTPDDLAALWPAFGPGGFKRLAAEGAQFTAARQDHAITLTCPGHAALLTGGYGALNGIVGNDWFDRAGRATGRCGGAGQPSCSVLCTDSPQTHRLAQGGMLRVDTIADAYLRAPEGGRALFISLKARSALIAARDGRTLPVWFAANKFITLSPETPSATAVSSRALPVITLTGADGDWLPLANDAPPAAADADAAPWERPPAGWTKSFPHHIPALNSPAFGVLFSESPFAATAETALALALIKRERYGLRGGRDFVLLSYSGYDLLAHDYGHHSREARDFLLRLDRELAALLSALQAQASPGKLRVILSSDHGAAEIPERRAARLGGGARAGRLNEADLVTVAENSLIAAFGPAPAGMKDAKYVDAFRPPHLYLNTPLLGARLSPAMEIAQAALLRLDHVAAVLTGDGVCALDDARAKLFCRDDDGERSGHLLVVPQENYFFGESATTHGTPWDYDRRVPLFIWPARAGEAKGDIAAPVSAACAAGTFARDAKISWPAPRAADCFSAAALAK